MSVASRSLKEQYRPVRRKIEYIITLSCLHLMKTNMTIGTLLVVLSCFHVASGVTHSLQYFYTGTSGIQNFPEFISVGLVDGQPISHYDSITKKVVPKAEWMAASVDSDYWKRQTEKRGASEAIFKVSIDNVKSRFNQTEGVHMVQEMYGCQWDDESGDVDGYDQYGYDGEDFVTLDLKNLRYIAANQQAVITKHKWDNNKGLLESDKHYVTQICIDWLKKYVQYGSSTLGRTVSPEVTLLQKDSRVVCHSTGFYPDGVMITLKRDGVDMHEDVDMGETLPNEDGTFQKRAELKVSPEERKKGHFTCEVAHKSGEPIVKILIVEEGNALIPNNLIPNNLVGIITGCVVAALVLIGVVVAIVMMKKKGYNKAPHSDTDSDRSNPIAREGGERVTC